jgi:hypothetical protein
MSPGRQAAREVAVVGLRHGETIHIAPHQVFRGTEFTHTVACAERDVQVDGVIKVEGVIVICWGHLPGTCGAVVYDATDTVTLAGVA